MTREEKYLSSSSSQTFMKLEGNSSPKTRQDFEAGDSEQFKALWKSQVSSGSHTVPPFALPPSPKGTCWALLCCPYSYDLAY